MALDWPHAFMGAASYNSAVSPGALDGPVFSVPLQPRPEHNIHGSAAHFPTKESMVVAALHVLDQIADSGLARLRRLIQPLVHVLNAIRINSSEEEWRQHIATMRAHRAFVRLLQDPYTARAFDKPRGYAGDAVTLDYIYRPAFCDPPEIAATPEGRAIYSYTTAGPASRAVQNRRTILAQFVDGLPGRAVRVASLACGHLREAELMVSLETGKVEQLFAIDQDPLSIDECARAYSAPEIIPTVGSVVDILRGRLNEISDLDFFYAAGLLDYLNQRLAQKLVHEMFKRLRSGGRLLVANFTPSTIDRGYMETCMDWWLTYRDEDEMKGLLEGLPTPAIRAARTFREAEQNIVFLEVIKD